MSTVLQVLLSIQGLILVSNPFYNEPGFEKQADTDEGARNCAAYNGQCCEELYEWLLGLRTRTQNQQRRSRSCHPRSLARSLACTPTEKARLLSLRHAAITASSAAAQTTPLGLTAVIRSHYKRRGPAIVQGVEALLESASSAAAAPAEANGASAAAEEPPKGAAVVSQPAPSTGFLRSLQKLLPKLKERLC